MKKLIILLLLGVSFMAAPNTQAQRAYILPLIAGDTVIDAATVSKVIHITGGYSGASIYVTVGKISGTGAGTVTVYGGNTGVTADYKIIGSAYTITDLSSQVASFTVTAPLPEYIKITVAGSGTEHIVPTVTYRLPLYQTQSF